MQPEIDYFKIGQRVKAARLKKNLNQSELAEMVDCSNNHLSHIEVGRTKLSLPMLLSLSYALGENLDYFLFDTPFAKSENLINTEIAKKLLRCAPATLIAVNKILDSLLEQQDALRSNS